MRTAAYGLVVGLLVAAVLAGTGFPEAHAQRPVPERGLASDALIALSFDGGNNRQQVTIVDPKARVVAVYHIDPASGSFTLRSVRNVNWDLQMEDFNSASPTPREIRNLAEQR